MGLSMAFRGDTGGAFFLGSVLAAVGLTFLTVMWLIVRGSEAG